MKESDTTIDKTFDNTLKSMFNGFSDTFLVEKPSRIIKVNSQYSVDIEYFNNNRPETLTNVPVKHLQSSKAYLFLGLNVGDSGTVRFFDNDVTQYYKGSKSNSSEHRLHDINDNMFSLGFYPVPEQYIFPKGDIVIGTVSGATIAFNQDEIIISGANVNVNASSVNVEASKINMSANTIIDGKSFLAHTHITGLTGKPTGGVI